jgi:hypothetical protein
MSGGTFVTLLGILAQAQSEGHPQAGNIAAIGGGLVSVVVGTCLLGHGIDRIHDIKVARRELTFRSAQVSMRDGGAYAGVSFGF